MNRDYRVLYETFSDIFSQKKVNEKEEAEREAKRKAEFEQRKKYKERFYLVLLVA